MNEERRAKHYVSKKTGKVFPAEEWVVGEPVDGKKPIPIDKFPLDIIYHDEKKREPLLSDDEMRKAPPFSLEAQACEEWDKGVEWARDYYERLIDNGRLRVVEEVESFSADPDMGCWRCGKLWMNSHFKFCPGCGGKIKR